MGGGRKRDVAQIAQRKGGGDGGDKFYCGKAFGQVGRGGQSVLDIALHKKGGMGPAGDHVQNVFKAVGITGDLRKKAGLLAGLLGQLIGISFQMETVR